MGQTWARAKRIGVDKHRELRTLGETTGGELTRLRVDRGWNQHKLAILSAIQSVVFANWKGHEEPHFTDPR
jgi:hypothetical protein